MNSAQDPAWTRIEAARTGPIRVLDLEYVRDDTFVIREGEEVSLSDGATLTLLLKQLSGRDT